LSGRCLIKNTDKFIYARPRALPVTAGAHSLPAPHFPSPLPKWVVEAILGIRGAAPSARDGAPAPLARLQPGQADDVNLFQEN